MRALILTALALVSVSASAVEENLIWSCDGYSQEGLQESDIDVRLTEQDGEFWLRIQIRNGAANIVSVEPKPLQEGEVSLWDIYQTADETVVLKAFGDDMGFMSELTYNGQTYDATCAFYGETE